MSHVSTVIMTTTDTAVRMRSPLGLRRAEQDAPLSLMYQSRFICARPLDDDDLFVANHTKFGSLQGQEQPFMIFSRRKPMLQRLDQHCHLSEGADEVFHYRHPVVSNNALWMELNPLHTTQCISLYIERLWVLGKKLNGRKSELTSLRIAISMNCTALRSASCFQSRTPVCGGGLCVVLP